MNENVFWWTFKNSLSISYEKWNETLKSLSRSDFPGDDPGEPLAHRYQNAIGMLWTHGLSSSL